MVSYLCRCAFCVQSGLLSIPAMLPVSIFKPSSPAPSVLWVVRHGQSAGNVASDLANSRQLPMLDIGTRDMDTPLSLLGERQADALGYWFSTLPPEEQPDVLLCSPYLRAAETARRMLQVSEMPTTLRMDERLREKEFGVLDRYTRFGIQQKFPDLFEQRAQVGKFYFRPPGGESWCDVILRLRSFMEMTAREYDGQRVLVVGHQVIVSCLRYLLEGLAEQEILAIDREGDVPNCGVTSYHFHAEGFRDGKLMPRLVNFPAPLEQAGTPVTAAKDVPVAPKA